MPVVTFSEAAGALGFRSRGTLYRLRDSGRLADYLRPGGRGGAQLLELEPPGERPLREHVARSIRLQGNNVRRYDRPPSVDPRWSAVAEALSDAAGVSLSAGEAETIASVLPEAVGAAWGLSGLEVLRQRLAAAGHPDVGPTAAPCDEGTERFWREYGGWVPAGELTESEVWEHVVKIAAAMKGDEPPLAGEDARLTFQLTAEALADVRAGARWDAAQWTEASERSEDDG